MHLKHINRIRLSNADLRLSGGYVTRYASGAQR